MSKKQIALSFSSPLLQELVAEQVRQIGEAEIGDAPDLLITDEVQDTSLPQLVLGKASAGIPAATVVSLPLRLGAIADQVRYLLSNRNRLAGIARDAVDLGAFILDPEESHLLHKSTAQIIRLTDKERLFLLTLFDAPDQAMDRRSLLDAVWGYAENVETHTLETHLYRLRQKLETYDAPDLIVSGDGLYRLNIAA